MADGPTFTFGFTDTAVPVSEVQALRARKRSLEFTDSEKKADHAVLELDNRDGTLVGSPYFRRGTGIYLTWGYEDRRAPTRAAIVTRVENWDPFRVHLKAVSVMLHKDRVSDAWESVTVSDVVTEIARAHGFESPYTFIDQTTDVEKVINQVRETDAEFLVRLAYKHGRSFWIDPAGFHWEERDLSQKPARVIRLGDGADGPGDVIGLPTLDGDLTRLVTAVVVTSDGETVPGSDTTVQRVGLATKTETSEDRDPEAVAGSRTERGSVAGALVSGAATGRVGYKTATGRPESRLVGVSVDHDPDRKPSRRAAAKIKRKKGDAVKLGVTIVGDPLLAARTVIRTRGFGPALDGLWYAKEVVHRISSGSGYTTRVSLVRDGHDGHGKGAKTSRSPGSRPGADPASSSGGSLITQRLEELARLTGARILGPTVSELLAIEARTRGTRAAWDQRGTAAVPMIRSLGRDARVLGERLNDPALRAAGAALVDAISFLNQEEVANEAAVNRATDLASETDTREITDSEGRPALSFRPRGARIER